MKMLSGTESKKNLKYHLIFIRKHKSKSKKTYVIDIFKRIQGRPKEHLGIIKWYGAFRKYIHYPDNDTGWSDDCMDLVSNFLKKLNKRHWRKLRKRHLQS